MNLLHLISNEVLWRYLLKYAIHENTYSTYSIYHYKNLFLKLNLNFRIIYSLSFSLKYYATAYYWLYPNSKWCSILLLYHQSRKNQCFKKWKKCLDVCILLYGTTQRPKAPSIQYNLIYFDHPFLFILFTPFIFYKILLFFHVLFIAFFCLFPLFFILCTFFTYAGRYLVLYILWFPSLISFIWQVWRNWYVFFL